MTHRLYVFSGSLYSIAAGVILAKGHPVIAAIIALMAVKAFALAVYLPKP